VLAIALPFFALAAAPIGAPADAPRDNREKAWSLSTVLELARERGETVDPSWKTSPVVVLPAAPMDNPDVKITTAANRTLSENSIAVSPLDNKILFCANNSTDQPVTQVFGTQVGWSTDGGLTWVSQNEGPGGVGNRGDPAAVIDRNGKFYVGFIHSSGGMGVSYSTDMGATWSHVAVTTAASQDKNHLMVDNVASSPYVGRVYNAWVDLGSGANANDIVFSYSSNGGAAWSAITNISNGVAAGSHNQGCNIQTGPNGEVYVCWSVYDAFPADETALGFNRSTNGGASWVGEARVVTGIRGHRNTALPNTSIRRNSFPSMAVDVSGGSRNGTIYMVWTNIGVPGVNTGDADIYMVKSTNQGVNWGTPVRVNDDATTSSQWFPWISCDPVTGDLSVVFYDRRDDAGNSLTTEYVAHSIDGGATWENFRVGDVQFTPTPIPGLAGGYMGDYLGIASRGGRAYPIWGDGRATPFTAFVSPIAYSDPDDPNPPTGVSAYSDYLTPTSIALAWTDPTTYSNGSPLTNFSINIYRDNVFLTNVDQGIQALVDGGLTDGVEYDYTLRAKDDGTDSLSLAVDVSWTAGGSVTPAPPTGLSCTADTASATLTWTNPTTQSDGTPLDDFAGIRIYRNNVLITTIALAESDTGDVGMAIDFPPPGFVYTYEVAAIDAEVPIHESTRAAEQCYVGSIPNILVWQPAPLATTSGQEIFNVLSGLGESVFYTQDLHEFGTDLSVYEIIFVVNGIYPANHILTLAEGTELEAFVAGGGRLYLESGDGFNYDPEAVSGYNYRPIFGVADGPDGSADLFNLTGLNDLSGLVSAYTGANNFIDELQPTTAVSVWKNTANTDIVGVFHLYGAGRALGSSHEFGGLDGAAVQGGPWVYEGAHPYEGPPLPMGADPNKPLAAAEAGGLASPVSATPVRLVANTDANQVPAEERIDPRPDLQSTTPADIMSAYLGLFRQSFDPNIVVNTTAIYDTLVESTSNSRPFTIRNQGALASPLMFTISESPAELWVSESPVADTLGANQEVTITVNFSASSLSAGTYTTSLEVASNAPSDPTESVAVNLVVLPRSIMFVDRENFDFTILAGDSATGSYTLYNNGGGTLNYAVDVDLVSGPAGGREQFAANINATTGSARFRGNVYSVTTPVQLTSAEFYMNLSTPTSVEFFVYTSPTLTGTFTKVYSSGTIVVGPGAQFYVSPSINLNMSAGTYYYVGTAWNESSTYYNDNGTIGVPEPTSFGALQYGAGASGFPAPASVSLLSSAIVYSQAVTTGFGVITSMVTATSGSVSPVSSVPQEFRAVANPLAPVGTYRFNVQTTGNDPLGPTDNIDVQVNVVGSLVGIEDATGSVPKAFALHPNEPNPFNPLTRVAFDLPRESRVRLTIFDAQGRHVTTLLDGTIGAGRYELPWRGLDDRGTSVASGIYFLRMEAGDFSERVKMTLLK
jgi:hypothetical protein